MSYDPKILNATPEEKSAAFEWLRALALAGGPDWRKAAIAMDELVRLNEAREAEVRLNDDGTLDEVVTKAGDQLEQMDYNHWFLQIGDVAVWLWGKGKIAATYERRPEVRPSPLCE